MATQDVEKGKKVPRGYVPWDDEMDKVLLDTFVEYYKKGDRCQNGWKSHVYTAAIKNVREKCGVNIAKSNIESRSKTFDKHYNIINGMLSSSGFGWDWERNKLVPLRLFIVPENGSAVAMFLSFLSISGAPWVQSMDIQTILREEIKSAYEYRPFDKCDYSARISNEIRVKKLEYVIYKLDTMQQNVEQSTDDV
ncbi:hypothetical protein EJB05_30448, partial [Eragrostis curvula]